MEDMVLLDSEQFCDHKEALWLFKMVAVLDDHVSAGEDTGGNHSRKN